MHFNVTDLKLTKIPFFAHPNGELLVVQGEGTVPFSISRVFIVSARDCAVRGRHAHRECSQFLICPSGVVEVICDDGEHTKTFVLDSPDVGLLVPPGIWSEQTYRGALALLTVLCDRRFEETDYIRDYEAFQALRSKCV